MYRRCQPLAPKHKFKFKNKLFSLDATVVSLCLALFP
jgi:putative transposase